MIYFGYSVWFIFVMG